MLDIFVSESRRITLPVAIDRKRPPIDFRNAPGSGREVRASASVAMGQEPTYAVQQIRTDLGSYLRLV
jgi:hypothetical protein